MLSKLNSRIKPWGVYKIKCVTAVAGAGSCLWSIYTCPNNQDKVWFWSVFFRVGSEKNARQFFWLSPFKLVSVWLAWSFQISLVKVQHDGFCFYHAMSRALGQGDNGRALFWVPV